MKKMIKRGKITEEKLAHIYSTIQKIIKNQQCYYTNEEIEDLKKNKENVFIKKEGRNENI